MEIVEFLNEDAVKDTVTNPKNNEILFVIDCGATWCAPCKTFAKFYDEFVKKHPKTDLVHFCKLDIQNFSGFCDSNKISSVPTILFIKNTTVIDRMEGADQSKFKAMLNKHLPQKTNFSAK